MSKCKLCKATDEPMMSGVINGEFISGLCRICFGLSKQVRNPKAELAKYKREREREDRAKDIEQPFIGNRPNPEFAKAYKDKARGYYSEKEMGEM